MVSRDSADVWARQREFRLDASLGAPPDALSADGQDWGLPAYRWDLMEAGGCEWLRRRLGRAAALFGGCRLDHVVGYYRMFVRRVDDEPVFTPQEEDEQRALGDRLLGLIQAAGRDMEIFGEDLGNVPDFVRAALATLGVPGYRILRWEADDGIVRDPCAYPALSVAAPGTHDTSSLASWWTDELDDEGRKAFAACPAFADLASTGGAFTPAVHAALLDGLYAAGSDRLVLPFADAYGGRERINVPATTGDENWAYQMPWPVEELDKPGAAEVGARLRALAIRHDRA
jgi:4-alpha-glucanotransferase